MAERKRCRLRAGVRVEHDGEDGRVSFFDGERVVVILGGVERTDVDPAHIAPLCEACGSPAAAYCTRCACVAYCGPACQRAHWVAHKRSCAPAEDVAAARRKAEAREADRRAATVKEAALVARFVDAMLRQDAAEVKAQALLRPPDQRTPLLQMVPRRPRRAFSFPRASLSRFRRRRRPP